MKSLTLPLYFVIFISLFCAVLHAQHALTEEQPQQPSTPGFQEETGQPDRHLSSGPNRPSITTRGQLEFFIFNEMQENHIPGLSASILKEGEIIWKDTFGFADFETSIPPKKVEESTLFMQASVSKTVTAVAIMQLWERGLFDLDDPVNFYLPNLWVASPHYPLENITIRMLMTHTSGIDDNWSAMPIYQGDSPIPLGEYLESYLKPGGSLYDPDLNFCTWKPGTDYEYSNIGISLVGYLVETITGMELDRYCQKYIYKPLGMRESSFFLAKLDPAHIAKPYYWSGSEYVSYGHYGRSHYPAGQLRTSVPQLGHFLQTFMDCREQGKHPILDSVRLLKSETVELMLTPQVPNINGSIGLIWNRATAPDGAKLWGHIGGFYGVRTSMRYGPENDIGIVLMTNGEGNKEDIFWAMYDYALNYD